MFVSEVQCDEWWHHSDYVCQWGPVWWVMTSPGIMFVSEVQCDEWWHHSDYVCQWGPVWWVMTSLGFCLSVRSSVMSDDITWDYVCQWGPVWWVMTSLGLCLSVRSSVMSDDITWDYVCQWGPVWWVMTSLGLCLSVRSSVMSDDIAWDYVCQWGPVWWVMPDRQFHSLKLFMAFIESKSWLKHCLHLQPCLNFNVEFEFDSFADLCCNFPVFQGSHCGSQPSSRRCAGNPCCCPWRCGRCIGGHGDGRVSGPPNLPSYNYHRSVWLVEHMLGYVRSSPYKNAQKRLRLNKSQLLQAQKDYELRNLCPYAIQHTWLDLESGFFSRFEQ